MVNSTILHRSPTTTTATSSTVSHSLYNREGYSLQLGSVPVIFTPSAFVGRVCIQLTLTVNKTVTVAPGCWVLYHTTLTF